MSSETITPEPVTPEPRAETVDAEPMEAESDGEKRPFRRVLLLLGGGFLAVVAIVVVVVVIRINAIERVDFDQDLAREALADVSAEDLAELRQAMGEAEAEITRDDILSQEQAIQDGDLLATAREELSDSEISASFLVPYATGVPVPDSLHDTYLLLGTDLSEFRADVIILVMLPRDGSEPVMVSLPRDTYLPNPCTKRNSRINAALFGCGDIVNGPELVALMVEDYTGVPVDHFTIVNFDGFTEVIDAFDGLTICVDNPVRDRKSDLSLPAGCSVADGESVLQWVRSRSTEELVNGSWRRIGGIDDFARQQRQQDVLLDIANKLGSFDSIASLTGVAAGLVNSVTFDEGMDLGSIVQTAWNLRDLDLSTIERLQPGFRHYLTSSGANVVVPTESFTDVYEAATSSSTLPGT